MAVPERDLSSGVPLPRSLVGDSSGRQWHGAGACRRRDVGRQGACSASLVAGGEVYGQSSLWRSWIAVRNWSV